MTRKMELIQRPDFSGLGQPHNVWNEAEDLFQAVAIGPQSQIDQVYLFSEKITDGQDKGLWTQVAGFNGDRYRRDRLIRGAYLVSVDRPLVAELKGPLWVADRFWNNRLFSTGDRQSIKDQHALYSAQVPGALAYLASGSAGGIANMRSFGLELELYRECPALLPRKRPPVVAVTEVNGATDWATATEQVVCALVSFGRGAAEISLALNNPGTGTYIFQIYGVNYMPVDMTAVESSNWTQLLETITVTTDNYFEVYNAIGHFDAYVLTGRNSAGADTANGAFMIKARDVD